MKKNLAHLAFLPSFLLLSFSSTQVLTAEEPSLAANKCSQNHFQICENDPGLSKKELKIIRSRPETPFVYIPEKVSHALLEMKNFTQNTQENQSKKSIYYYLDNHYKIAPYGTVQNAVKNACSFLKQCKAKNMHPQFFNTVAQPLKEYLRKLKVGDAEVVVADEQGHYGQSVQAKSPASEYKIYRKLIFRKWLKASHLHVRRSASISGNLKVNGTINGKTAVGPTGPAGPAGPTGAPGATGTFSGTIADNAFTIVDATDATKQLKFDVQGSPSTTTTIITNPTANRSLTTTDYDGTLLASDATTGQVFIGANTTLHGSNAGIQYSTLVSQRASLRVNQYGTVAAAVPGIVGFRSRSTTIGGTASVLVGDILWGATAIGVTGNNTNVPNAALAQFIVTAVNPTFLQTNFDIQQNNAGGTRITAFRVTSDGNWDQTVAGQRIRIKEGTNAMAGVATLVAGTITVPNTIVTTSSHISVTIQPGPVPAGTIYVSTIASGTFTISSTNAGDTCNVYWQVWEPAP